MGTSEMEQTIYIDRTLGDSVQISMTEFVFYLTLIEELLDELEKDVEISPNVIPEPPSGYLVFEPDFEDYLDEFDRYEIEQMRIKFGLSESRTVVTRGSDWDGKK
ncbi:MAG: hypothetical protein JSV27_07025 [Candidatus Bathyarchaeota archaeon]|nr:MAG: hypothetical protein JSV27_07025 [Candidatus Bathyarchaeota archaeon]